jgi:hypothetical protein
MANVLNGNPTVIDTFGAGDVTVSSTPITVTCITATAQVSAKSLTFIDNDGNVVFFAEVPSYNSLIWSPNKPFVFYNGLIFDDSASDFGVGDDIYIYKR